MYTSTAEMEQGNSRLLFSALLVSTRTVYLIFTLHFAFVILLFGIVPKSHAEMLSSAPKCEKAVMYLMEKIRVLERLISRVAMLLTMNSMLLVFF